MNCKCFQDQLFEFVDGTLSAEALAAAQTHLAQCDGCRQAVERENHLASELSNSFRQDCQSLALRQETRRNILATLPPKESALIVPGSLIDLCKYWLRLAIPSATLLVTGVLLAVHFFGTRSHERISAPIQPRVAVTSPDQTHPETSISVEISYRLPMHEFRREENTVVDAFVDETVVVNQTIPSDNLKSPPRRLEIKTPL